MARILIGGDNSGVLELISPTLIDLGHEILLAGDGGEAVEKSRAWRPDLIICDLPAWDLEEFEFVRRLRAHPGSSLTPVIFLSAGDHDSGGGAAGKGPGASRFLHRVPDRQDADGRAAALIGLGRDLGAERDPAKLLRKFCRSTREILSARQGALGILEPGGVRISYLTDSLDAPPGEVGPVPLLSPGLLATILRANLPLRLCGPQLDLRGIGLPESFGAIDTFLGVPLTHGQNLQGMICLGNKLGGEAFSQEDESLAMTLAAQFALAHQNAVLSPRRQERKNRVEKELVPELSKEALAERARLSAMEAEVAQTLVQGSSLGEILQHCAKAMVKRLDAVCAHLWTFNEGERTLELEASASIYSHLDGQPARVPLGRYRICRIAEERKPHFTNHVLGDPTIAEEEWAKADRLVSFAGYPLVVGDRLLGVMALFAREPLSTWTLGALASIANGIAHRIQRKRVETELMLAKDTAESANRLKNNFFANMSHEVRTPMTAMLGYLGLIKERLAGDPDGLEYLAVVERSGHHLLQLFDDLLDISRIEAGRLKILCAPCSPLGILRDVLQTVSVQAEGKGLILTHTCHPPIPETVLSDSTRIRQALLNLVGNAVKFTEKGGVNLALWALPSEGEKVVLEFSVQDTGIGIPEDKLRSIFETFHQLDPSSTRRFGGAGLGLSISYRLAKLLGGDLRVRSREGRGSTFTLSITCGVPAEIETTASRWDGRKSEGVRPDDLEAPPPRILVAEDTPESQYLIRLYLNEGGMAVDVVDNGKQAIEKCDGAAYDAIIMDLQMQVMDGFQALGALRQRKIDTPVVALTAHAMKGDRQRCMEAGFDAYMAKPFKKEALLRVLSGVIQRRHIPVGTGSTRHAEQF